MLMIRNLYGERVSNIVYKALCRPGKGVFNLRVAYHLDYLFYRNITFDVIENNKWNEVVLTLDYDSNARIV